jgi:glycosyltransferase involved in cell wall biosynthesis
MDDVRVMRSLRILHVTPYFKDAWAYGGIPRLAHALTRGLAQRGHSVTVCTTDVCDHQTRLQGHEITRTRFRAWTSTTSDGVEVRVFPNLSNRLAYHLQFFVPAGLDRYMADHAASFDVAHLHACRNLPGVIAARHLRAAGVPYVLAPNGTAPRIERRRLAKLAFDVVTGNRVLSGATRVLAVTGAERRQLRTLGVHDQAIDVIPNPIDLDEFSVRVEPGAFRRRLGDKAPDGTPLVLFLGKLTPRKRLDVLVRAFARLRRSDARLVIAGNDMGAGSAARALTHTLNLDGRAIFTGLLRDRERLEALADADVLVYPSQHEIFGLVPLESLLSGTPVVVAGDSGCGEVVHATGGGSVVPAGDVDALAAAIDDVLNAPARWRVAASTAASRVRAAYGGDAVCSQLEHLYSEIAGPPEGGHYVR